MQRKKKHCYKQKFVMPDHELLHWEKWIQIRNEETTKLSMMLDKPPVDLAMNLLDKVREKKEWKVAIEHAQIEKKPKLRGGLWQQPVSLKQPCDCKPVYQVHMTRAEKGKPKTVQHISVPQYIQIKEKGQAGTSERNMCSMLNADFVKCKLKREEDLKEKLLKIYPYKPDPNLIVIGIHPKPPPVKLPPLPKIVIGILETAKEHLECHIYAIRINNTVLVKNIPGQNLRKLETMKKEVWHETCTTWTYYFNVSMKKAGRCKVFMQNLGTVALRYYWKKIKSSVPLVPEPIYEQVFYFNKNEDVISPGQRKEILFTFISPTPGIFNEFWEICFGNVNFFDNVSEKLIIKLYGDFVEDVIDIENKCHTLRLEINHKAICNIVIDILDDILIQATTIKPQEYPYKKLFLEAEMFVMKNPVCFYHQTEVKDMTDLYSEMSRNQSWDLSIASWREAMMAKEFPDRMKYYDLLKKSHHELLKPYYEGEDLLQQKHRAVNLLLKQMADMFDSKYTDLVDTYSASGTTSNNIIGGGDSSWPQLKDVDPLLGVRIRNVFYMHAYEYVATTIESCAGVLSSLDLNRWIEFDFCRT